MMSSKEYVVTHRAKRCPVCNSKRIDATDDIQMDGGSGLQPMGCEDCGARWTENWQVIGFTMDEPVPG